MSRRSRDMKDEAGAADRKVASSRRRSQASFVAGAKDEVYKASEIVREEAADVEHMAVRVEKLSRTIEDDVDHVEAAVHQMITTINSKEGISNNLELNSEDSLTPSTKSPTSLGNSITKDSLTLKRSPEIIFHVMFFLLTLVIVLLHNWTDFSFGNLTFGQRDKNLTANSSSVITSKSTTFSIFFIYIGTIWRVLKSLRNAMSRQKDGVVKVEEKVHEIGQEVKSVAGNIERIADTVEHISHQIEEEASQVELLTRPVEEE